MTCHQGRESTVSVNEDIADCVNGRCAMRIALQWRVRAAPVARQGATGLVSSTSTTTPRPRRCSARTSKALTSTTRRPTPGRTRSKELAPRCRPPRLPRVSHATRRRKPRIPSDGHRVFGCHGGGAEFSELGAGVSDDFEDIQTLLAELLTAIENYTEDTLGGKVVYDGDSYPYWFDSEGDATASTRRLSKGPTTSRPARRIQATTSTTRPIPSSSCTTRSPTWAARQRSTDRKQSLMLPARWGQRWPFSKGPSHTRRPLCHSRPMVSTPKNRNRRCGST